MKKALIIGLILVFIPSIALTKEKRHIKTLEDQECSECHPDQLQAWQDGKHGLMNVKCVVCHGSTDKNFIARPDIYRCRGCHGEKVKDIEKRLPLKVRSCFLCHDPHSLAAKFHKEGGK